MLAYSKNNFYLSEFLIFIPPKFKKMNTKTIVAAVLSAVVTFLLGWLIYGILLMNYFDSHMMHYPGLMKAQPDFLYIGLANLAWGLLTAYILQIAGITTVSKGLITGAIVSCLSTAGYDLIMFAQFNLSSRTADIVDVAASTVLGAVSGAVIGWWYGRGKTA